MPALFLSLFISFFSSLSFANNEGCKVIVENGNHRLFKSLNNLGYEVVLTEVEADFKVIRSENIVSEAVDCALLCRPHHRMNPASTDQLNNGGWGMDRVYGSMGEMVDCRNPLGMCSINSIEETVRKIDAAGKVVTQFIAPNPLLPTWKKYKNLGVCKNK